MSKPDPNPTLTISQWVLMNAIELGKLDLDHLVDDLKFLQEQDLVEHVGSFWQPTEHGKLLIALRRQI